MIVPPLVSKAIQDVVKENGGFYMTKLEVLEAWMLLRAAIELTTHNALFLPKFDKEGA